MAKYPSWKRINSSLIVSEEQRDGTPDFYVAKDGDTKLWSVKWRTSAHWEGPYASADEAKASVATAVI